MAADFPSIRAACSYRVYAMVPGRLRSRPEVNVQTSPQKADKLADVGAWWRAAGIEPGSREEWEIVQWCTGQTEHAPVVILARLSKALEEIRAAGRHDFIARPPRAYETTTTNLPDGAHGQRAVPLDPRSPVHDPEHTSEPCPLIDPSK